MGGHMHTRGGVWLTVVITIVGLSLLPPGLVGAQGVPVKLEWLSWSIFRLTSPNGKVVLTDPFVANPDSPVKAAEIEKADIILVADGHPDQLFGGAKRPFMSGTWAHRRLTWTSLHRSL